MTQRISSDRKRPSRKRVFCEEILHLISVPCVRILRDDDGTIFWEAVAASIRGFVEFMIFFEIVPFTEGLVSVERNYSTLIFSRLLLALDLDQGFEELREQTILVIIATV